MRLTIRAFGLDLLDVELTTGETEAAEEDLARDLSGGSLGSDCLDAGTTGLYMGFTNGREVGDDD